MPSLLVTVGSTRFPALTDHITHPDTFSSLLSLGVTHITIQHGTQPLPQTTVPPALTVHAIRYASDFPRLLSQADLVVSHAGSGTVLEAVKLSKPLVVVVNSSLMDNHQAELADAMSRCGCCHVLRDSCLSGLTSALESVMHRSHSGNPPVRQRALFGALVAQELTHAHQMSQKL